MSIKFIHIFPFSDKKLLFYSKLWYNLTVILLKTALHLFSSLQKGISMPKQTFFNLPDAKKDHIIRAAVEEFSKALYQEISINHLIKCMEIPTGSFYQYFDDKRDLYFYILSHYLDQMLDESVHDGKHLDILHPNSKSTNTSIFAHTIRKSLSIILIKRPETSRENGLLIN